jgi:hypothetical protein
MPAGARLPAESKSTGRECLQSIMQLTITNKKNFHKKENTFINDFLNSATLTISNTMNTYLMWTVSNILSEYIFILDPWMLMEE